MTDEKHISGIHHITAIASAAAENRHFYESILGLRLVKQTVNFDDPFTYHLYYGDAQGTPGTILTFFPWEDLPQGRPGAGMVTAISFAVPDRSIDFWNQRLRDNGVSTKMDERFSDPVIRLTDPHGLAIELTGTRGHPSTVHWKDGPVSEPNAIMGFHSATATVTAFEKNQALLTKSMGLRLQDQANRRYRFKFADPATPGQYYDLVVDPKAAPGRPGGGTVHHVAFRTANDDTQAGWQSALRADGFTPTPVRDRKYFRSIYFNAPEGVLFEIATDPPGFTVDEASDQLGASLMLPDRLESRRADIEKRLPSLRLSSYEHVYQKPGDGYDDDHTLVTLHGTGGN
jgi:glyoxalase family protein